MRWKEQLLNLTPYQPGKSIESVKRQFNLDKIVKLASNENPFGSSDLVVPALSKVSAALYPDGYATELRNTLAEFLKVDQDQIIFGNGSDEVIQMISRSLLTPDTNTVMAVPTFPQYKHNAVIEGAEVREVPLIDGAHNLPGMLAAIDDQTRVVWLCSPNNPTGVYITDSEVKQFIEQVPKDVLIVLDEAYYEYVEAEDYYNSLELIKAHKNLIVTRTFSKIYGLASFRVGYGVADAAIIRALEPVREPFNTNSYAQLAAKIALADQAYIAECKQKNRQGLEQFYQFCKENKLNYYPSQGNFILIDFNVDGNEVFQYLMERGYIVRSGQALGFPTSVRITVGSTEQNEGIIELLKQFLMEKAAFS